MSLTYDERQRSFAGMVSAETSCQRLLHVSESVPQLSSPVAVQQSDLRGSEPNKAGRIGLSVLCELRVVDGVSHQEFCAILGESSRHTIEETRDIGRAR
jgi:hypothetical protein